MMHKVESEILEAVVSKSEEIFDPLTQQIENLTVRLEEINAREDQARNKNEPRTCSSFNLRAIPGPV